MVLSQSVAPDFPCWLTEVLVVKTVAYCDWVCRDWELLIICGLLSNKYTIPLPKKKWNGSWVKVKECTISFLDCMWHSPGVPSFMHCPCVRDSLALLCTESTPQLVSAENAALKGCFHSLWNGETSCSSELKCKLLCWFYKNKSKKKKNTIKRACLTTLAENSLKYTDESCILARKTYIRVWLFVSDLGLRKHSSTRKIQTHSTLLFVTS